MKHPTVDIETKINWYNRFSIYYVKTSCTLALTPKEECCFTKVTIYANLRGFRALNRVLITVKKNHHNHFIHHYTNGILEPGSQLVRTVRIETLYVLKRTVKLTAHNQLHQCRRSCKMYGKN
jgi:hypothetical protein